MGNIELFILAVSLAMDAFAVSICKGLSIGKIKVRHMCKAGFWFGGFQALMPLIGYFLGKSFADVVSRYSNIIAFVLLALIGGNMIRESIWGDDEEESADNAMDVKTMFLLAVATSIDALAVGVMFAFLKVNIVWSVSVIGVVTFAFSALGIKIGSIFGTKFQKQAEIAGGVILILLGIKILLKL